MPNSAYSIDEFEQIDIVLWHMLFNVKRCQIVTIPTL